MAAEGPSWADQWGVGGIGAMEEDGSSNTKKEQSNKKNSGKAGFGRAKATAMVGAQKIKSGASASFKWVKNQCQRKSTSK